MSSKEMLPKNQAVLYARNVNTNYENFIAECPHCGHENIFNRISDLKTTEPIDCRQVFCMNRSCKRLFKINGDSVNERYEYLLYDCHELLKIKRYMYCILNVCQAYEAFFTVAIQKKLLWDPRAQGVFSHDCKNELEIINKLSRILYESMEKFTFKPLANIFFDLCLNPQTFTSKQAVEKYIQCLECAAKKNPKDDEIKSYPNRKVSEVLLRLKEIDINELRNRVVHKEGYRPSREEVEKSFKEAQEIIFDLSVETEVKLR